MTTTMGFVALFVQEFDAGALPQYDKHAGEEREDW